MSALTAILLTLAVVTIALSAREAWCHAYYPLRGRLYWEQGQPELAAAAWRAYLAAPLLTGRRQKQWARLALAQCLYRLGQWQDAATACDDLLRAAREALLVQLGRRLRAAAQHRVSPAAPAEPTETDARAADAEAMWARRIEVERLDHDGDWARTLSELVELERDLSAVGSPEDLARVRIDLARKRLALGYAGAAADVIERVPRGGLPPSLRWQAHLVSGWISVELERFDHALRQAESAQHLVVVGGQPNDLAEVHLLQGVVASQRNDYVVAMRHFQSLRECGGPGRWIAPLHEAMLLALWGRHDEARRAFEQAWTNLPEDLDQQHSAAIRLALVEADYCWRHDLDRAVGRLDSVLDRPATDPRAAIARSAAVVTLWTVAGRDVPAPDLERVTAARTTFAHDRHLLVALDVSAAAAAAHRGQLADAVAAYRQALTRPCHDQLRPQILYWLGQLHQAAGDDTAARDAYTEASHYPAEIEAVLLARQALQALPEATA